MKGKIMVSQDLHNNILAVRALSPIVATDNTPLVSEIVDTLQGVKYESVEFVIAIGTLADADATFVVLVEDGDDSALSDGAAVVDAFLLGTEAAASFTFADDDSMKRIGYSGKKQYVRLTITPADNTGNAGLAVSAILGDPRTAPVANN
jgi:hypothetical protein